MPQSYASGHLAFENDSILLRGTGPQDAEVTFNIFEPWQLKSQGVTVVCNERCWYLHWTD